MKKEDIPQDKGALENFTREVCYVKDKDGHYTTELSSGWDVKTAALDHAWDEIQRRIADAKAEVESGKASPILYFMELKLMDIGVLAGYTGFWKLNVKRHMKPSVFKGLSDAKLQKYADAFEIKLEELKAPF